VGWFYIAVKHSLPLEDTGSVGWSDGSAAVTVRETCCIPGSCAATLMPAESYLVKVAKHDDGRMLTGLV
jgi:hypothetical protein